MSDIMQIPCCFVCVTLEGFSTALVCLHMTLTRDSSGTLKSRISTKFNYYINNIFFFSLVHPVLLLLYMIHCNEMYRGVLSHLLS